MFVEFLKLPPVPAERTNHTRLLAPLKQFLGGRIQPDGGNVMAPQSFADTLAYECSPAQRQNQQAGIWGGQGFREHTALKLAKPQLSILFENLCHPPACPGLNQLIEVCETPAQTVSQCLADRGLARAHKPYQRDR